MRWAGMLALAAGLAAATGAAADEPLFGYVYTTDVLPRGKVDVEQWATLREGRSRGDFHLLQTRSEVSFGLTDDLQLSGYLNLAWADARGNTPAGETAPPEVFADYSVQPGKRFDRARVEGVSGELIWRLASPYTAPVGLALYVEPTIGPRTREMEYRLIAQKNFRDDRLVLAANLTLANEWRYLQGDPDADPATKDFRNHWDKETDLNLGVGATYRFRENWSAGFEALNEREWAGLNPFDPQKRTNVAWYAGPNLHYGSRHVFATATLLFQLKGARDYANPAPGFVVHGLTDADDFERMRLRLKVGYAY